MQFKPLLLGAFVVGALAANYNVTVGGEDGETVYEPSTLSANVGDTVTFKCKSS